MNFVLKPWQFALFVIAGWVSREQQRAIEYLCGTLAGIPLFSTPSRPAITPVAMLTRLGTQTGLVT